MAVHRHLQGYSGSQPHDKAHSLVCRCMEAHKSWAQARDPHKQMIGRQAYRAALEDLYQFLYVDLQSLIIQWLLRRVGPELLDEQSQLLVMHEVVDAYVMNVFAVIASTVPNMSIGDHTDVYAELITLAEHSLYS